MAFEITDEWTTSRPAAAAACLKALGGSGSSAWLEHPRIQKSRMPLIIALSAGLHAGFLFLLIQHGFVPIDDLKRFGPAEEKVTIFELAEPPKPTPLADLREEGSGAGEQQAAQNVAPIFQQPPVMPSEWSIARIKVPRASAINLADVGSTQGLAGTSGTGQGAGNGAGFDPYAGASPRRRDNGVNVGMGLDELKGTIDPRLNREAFIALVQRLRDQLGLTKGTIMLAVDVGPDGRIRAAEIKGGDANVQLKLFVRMTVIGEQLFRGGVSSRHAMPPIRI